ncbi:MAG: VWA domain-containing protein, partial [Clostridiales bacterium]|nr:VWA domain-containing protein [Clostridiales bacterium]
MKNVYLNFKKYIEECVRSRARRRRLYALLTALSLIAAGGVAYGLIRPAITATAQPECGLEEHVHGEGCYERHLVCALPEDDNHRHDESCYATVLVCGLPEHMHADACYPEKISEDTLPPQENTPTVEPDETATPEPAAEATVEPTAEATAEVTVEPTAETTAEVTVEPTAETTAEATVEPTAETTAEATTEPTAEATVEATNEPTSEPTAEITVEPTAEATAEPTDAPQTDETALLGALTGTSRMLCGETGLWRIDLHGADAASYTVCMPDGTIVAEGALPLDGAVDFSRRLDESGLYTVRVTAMRGEESADAEMELAVSAGEMQAYAAALDRSCFGGDETAFALGAQGGVAPVKRHVTVVQGGILIYEADDPADEIRVSALTLEDVSDIELHIALTDACGETAEAAASLPCAVLKTETRAQWEASMAQVELTGVWPDDLLNIARSQLGYEESKLNFIIDDEGNRQGYTRYGAWYRASYSEWCAMYVSFCLNYAEIPETVVPREANCEKWIRALSSEGLYVSAAHYAPQPGDLIFFDWEQDGNVDHVGLVEAAGEGTITTIEGNSRGGVRRNEYRADNDVIAGYGLLNAAYEAYLAAQPSASPEASVTPEPVDDILEPSVSPEESASPEEGQSLDALIDALQMPAGDADEETSAAYAAQYDAAVDAVFAAHDALELDDGAFEPLLVRLIERQMGGATARYAAQYETIHALKRPADGAAADEIIEYDHLIAALREQLAASFDASEITRPEYALLQLMMARIPASPIDCVYTALDGAVRLVHAESADFGGAVLTVTPCEGETYALYMEEIAQKLALQGRSVDGAMLMDIDFSAESPEADVSIRLDGALAAGETVLVAHRGADGWEWLDAERLTDEDGQNYVAFRTGDFSPFAVLAVSEGHVGADLAAYTAEHGGKASLTLIDAEGAPLEADENGVYTVNQNAEYTLNMAFDAEYGFEAGAYAYALGENAVPAGEGDVLNSEAAVGAWRADAENGCVRVALDVGAPSMRLSVPVSFIASEDVFELGGMLVRCVDIPTGPVAEVAVGDNWKILRDSGYFEYWSNKIAETKSQTATVQSYAARAVAQSNQPSDQQVVKRGGSNENTGDGVKVSKTIAGTELENVFDITLTVDTPTEISRFYTEPDMAVVIVMDISNTMNSEFGGDKSTRYKAAMEAAEAFLDKFAASSDGISRIGYVAFNTNAHEIFGLQSCKDQSEANSLKNTMRQKTGKIINANGYGDDHSRFTNIEAGLKKARDMLDGASNENKYIIFLSDGFPTTYISNGYDGYDPYCSSGTPGNDGVFYDMVTKKYCRYGTSYSDKAAIRARNMAASIKNSGATIFSIGVDVGGQTIKQYVDQTAQKPDHSVVDRTSETYEIGSADSTQAYKNWLRNSIGSGYYYDSPNLAGLEDAYNDICEKI